MEYVTIIEDNIYIHLKIRSGEKTVQEDKFASVIYSRQSIKKKRNYVKFSFVCTLIDHNWIEILHLKENVLLEDTTRHDNSNFTSEGIQTVLQYKGLEIKSFPLNT